MTSPPLPEWKVQLLERKRREEEMSRQREKDQEERLANMPAWKREIIERRKAKQGALSGGNASAGASEPEFSAANCVPHPLETSQRNLEQNKAEEHKEEDRTVLRETIAPVHQNPFIKLQRNQKNQLLEQPCPTKDDDVTSCRVKQIGDTYGHIIPCVRTIRAENIIIIKSEDAPVVGRPLPEQVLKSQGAEGHWSSRIAGDSCVTEIRASEILIIKSSLSHSVGDLNSLVDGGLLPEEGGKEQGRVSQLLSKFGGQEWNPGRPVRSRSTENILMDNQKHQTPHSFLPSSQWEATKVGGKGKKSAANPPGGSNTLPQVAALDRAPHRTVVAGYRSQFETTSCDTKRHEPPGRSLSYPSSSSSSSSSSDSSNSINSQHKHSELYIQSHNEVTKVRTTAIPRQYPPIDDVVIPAEEFNPIPNTGLRQGASDEAAEPILPDLSVLGGRAASKQASDRGAFQIKPAPSPDFSQIPEGDVQALALANLRAQSRNSFVVIPKRPPGKEEEEEEDEEEGQRDFHQKQSQHLKQIPHSEDTHQPVSSSSSSPQPPRPPPSPACHTFDSVPQQKQEAGGEGAEAAVETAAAATASSFKQEMGVPHQLPCLSVSCPCLPSEPLQALSETSPAASPAAVWADNAEEAGTRESHPPAVAAPQPRDDTTSSTKDPDALLGSEGTTDSNMSRIYNLKPVVTRTKNPPPGAASVPAPTAGFQPESSRSPFTVRPTASTGPALPSGASLCGRPEGAEGLSLQHNSQGPKECAPFRSLGRGHTRTGATTFAPKVAVTAPEPAIKLSTAPAMQRKGNTITINPRKMAGSANSAGVGKTAPPTVGAAAVENGGVAEGAENKKRYPTVEEIRVIGGYLSLDKSCLAKGDTNRKKLRISFSDSRLETMFEYPSESSLLAELGLDDEPEAPPPGPPAAEEEEEEETVMFTHRVIPGSPTGRAKPLLVDESCRR
ncbi:taperin-like [Huso huso]|uniref:Taperin-like n=1 Tax=Huso huso TaxID=61971 RepID=A0ABR0YC83_HUSHU